MLDGGLRSGEALGLRWGAVVWGESDDDVRRALVIEESRPRGGKPGPTKSGRVGRVALSRRMRDALFELYRERRSPDPGEHVIQTPKKTLDMTWRRVVRRAKIGHVRPKDLRDTFASQLLTAGIQLGYISKQLGHASLAVTERHYARWIEHEGDGYREPMQLEPGGVPADLLARLQKRPHSDPSLVEVGSMGERGTASSSAQVRGAAMLSGDEDWRAQHDLNVRPPGPQPGALSN